MNAPSEDLYADVIGPTNTKYYLAYFKRADERGYTPLAWHWPVVFLAVFWFLYRKQYRWAGIVILVSLSHQNHMRFDIAAFQCATRFVT